LTRALREVKRLSILDEVKFPSPSSPLSTGARERTEFILWLEDEDEGMTTGSTSRDEEEEGGEEGEEEV